jgi:Family of unknown function (DUF5330)
MRFLLRVAFWLTIILALLPSGGSKPPPKLNVSAIDAISAATATVTDVRSFCERQSDACTVGSRAAVAIGHRAQAGAKIVYEYLNEHLGSYGAGMPLNDASAKALPLPVPRPSQHTLSPPDLGSSPWRSPQSPNQVRSDGPT